MDVREFTEAGEGSAVEFKRTFPGRDDALATVVAFANTAGGDLIIGVDDDGAIMGVDPRAARDYEQKLGSWVAQLIEPAVVPVVKTARTDDRLVLIVSVDRGYQQPYYLVSEGPETGAYVRIGASTRRAGPSSLESMRLRSQNTSFDSDACVRAGVSVLSRSHLDAYIHARREVRDIPPPRRVDANWLVKMRFAARLGGRTVPTNAGVLLFAENPQDYLPQNGLELARFRGTEASEFVDKQSASGPIVALYREGLGFLKKHVERRALRTSRGRSETYAYPEEAMREFVVNALCHRDYGTGTGPARLAIFDDVIEITSPGALPPGLELGDLGRGISVLRNPVVGRVLEEMGLIEGWGTGIQIAQSALARASLPPAEILLKGPFTQIASKWRWAANLPPDLEAVLQIAANRGTVDSQGAASALGCTDRTARTKLRKLVDQGMLLKRGATKGAVYVLP